MITGDGPYGFVPPTLIPSRVGHPNGVVGSPSVNTGRQRTVSSSLEELGSGNGPALGAYRTS